MHWISRIVLTLAALSVLFFASCREADQKERAVNPSPGATQFDAAGPSAPLRTDRLLRHDGMVPMDAPGSIGATEPCAAALVPAVERHIPGNADPFVLLNPGGVVSAHQA